MTRTFEVERRRGRIQRAARASLIGVSCLCAVVGMASADDVYLHNGGVFEGVVAEIGETHISIELPIGRIKLPTSQVARVVEADSPIEIFRERRSELLGDSSSSAASWLELAQYARAHELERDARDTALLAARLEPDPGSAEAELLASILTDYGFVRDEALGWVPIQRSMARQGLVLHRGEWLRPEDRQAQIDLELRELALERERQAAIDDRLERSERASSGASGASVEDVALEAVKLARDVVRQPGGGPRFGQVVGVGGFYPGVPTVIPALLLSGSFEQPVPAAGAPVGGDPPQSSGSQIANPQVAGPQIASPQIDWDVIANRQPGSIISLRDQSRQTPRR